ncbi:MAG: three-Cys-motif partner protein TcmP, partial [Saprospiraceae bacterium]
KLQTYGGYLEKYIQVLVAYQGWDEIKLFDVFCGSGIYEDGKIGSPILAFDAIKMNREWCVRHKKHTTQITLNINDLDKTKVDAVERYLSSQMQPANTQVKFNNLPARDFLNQIQEEVNIGKPKTRNLIFIDPYGYKEIKADTIYNLLKNGTTEIVLFLPVSFIYRFAEIAQVESEVKQYEHLRDLISGFFKPDHPIQRNEVKSPLEFIKSLKEAMSFDERYYSASYYIQRDRGNYFALFFMTPNLKGLEKFLETKWEVDPVKGQGYKMPNPKGPSLFDDQFEKDDRDDRLQSFADALKDFLKSNQPHDFDIYRFTLNNEFVPVHTNAILKEWQDANALEVWDKRENKPARKGSFNIAYDSTKAAGSKFTFKMK